MCVTESCQVAIITWYDVGITCASLVVLSIMAGGIKCFEVYSFMSGHTRWSFSGKVCLICLLDCFYFWFESFIFVGSLFFDLLHFFTSPK